MGDSLDFLRSLPEESVDLVVTSPPFPLLRQKEYGNPSAEEYLDWFVPYATEMRRVLKPTGSLVLDLGGAWKPGLPVREIYQYELLVRLVRSEGFHLAQEFFWWNPARLPTPIEWVNVRRLRVKDGVNTVWWLSKTPFPKADNRRVLWPYSKQQRLLQQRGVAPAKRPSGHEITERFCQNNGGAIPPNLIALAHTESNSAYLRYCRQRGLKPHPARFPVGLPAFFIRFLTDPGDLVLDPFAGSLTTGEAAEALGRRWVCVEKEAEYVLGGIGRFLQPPRGGKRPAYQVHGPAPLGE